MEKLTESEINMIEKNESFLRIVRCLTNSVAFSFAGVDKTGVATLGSSLETSLAAKEFYNYLLHKCEYDADADGEELNKIQHLGHLLRMCETVVDKVGKSKNCIFISEGKEETGISFYSKHDKNFIESAELLAHGIIMVTKGHIIEDFATLVYILLGAYRDSIKCHDRPMLIQAVDRMAAVLNGAVEAHKKSFKLNGKPTSINDLLKQVTLIEKDEAVKH